MSVEVIKHKVSVDSSLSTREQIIQAAQLEIHNVGFRSASVSSILKSTGLTKGAFYHHFSSKDELGLAVINESLKARIEQNWLFPLSEYKDPISGLMEHLMMLRESMSQSELICGCPLNNMAQEMSSVNEDFRKAINNIFELWITGFEDLFKKGQQQGYVTIKLDARGIATFIITCLQGMIGLTKSSQSVNSIDEGIESLKHFLNSLRPEI